MMPVNVEFKARVAGLADARHWLQSQHARFIGTDEQVDVYFRVPEGRLKLRIGNIERALIYYRREENAAIRQSDVWLYPLQDAQNLKQLLAACLGILGEVHKKREIYFIGQTKFHLDEVSGLGFFVEAEVIEDSATVDKQQMEQLAAYYRDSLHIAADQLVQASYLDLILAANDK